MSNRFLVVYSGVLTAAVVVALLTGASTRRDASFDTIDVQRINVREPDGTLRLVVSNQAEFPGLVLHNKEIPHARPQAGMLFYNAEGTETGGLIFDGRRDANGTASSGVSLTFDRYEQDQQLQLLGVDEQGRHFAGLTVNDVPSRPILQDIEERSRLEAMAPEAAAALMAERRKSNYYGATRLYAGKSPDQAAVVQLADATGHPRLALKVTPEGQASLQFLDAAGKVVGTVTPESLAQSRH